jgi:hypothetical protein
MGEMEIKQDEIGFVLLQEGDRGLGVISHRDDAIAGVILH